MNPRLILATGFALVLAGSAPMSACKAFAPFAQDEKKDDPSAAIKVIKADLEAGKIDPAIEKIEKFTKDNPKDRPGMFFLAMLTQQKASQMIENRKASIPVFLKSAAAARKLRDMSKGQDLPPQMANIVASALYNGACSLALDEKPKEALAMLDESIDAGFAELNTIESDKEIDSLRKMPEFAAIMKKAKSKGAEAEAKAKAAEEEAAKKAVAEVPTLFKEFKPFDFKFTLPDLMDKKVSLADYKGKVVIVDIWGTWCPPCKKEIPHFIDLHKEYKDKGLEIVGINYEDGEPAEVKKVIADFNKENKVPYTCVIGDEKTQMQVPEFEGYPTTLFIDRAGKVRLKVVGYHAKPVLDAIVKTLLDEKAE